MVELNNVMTHDEFSVDISVDDIYESLNEKEKKEMFGLILYNDGEFIFDQLKEFLGESAEELGYEVVSE